MLGAFKGKHLQTGTDIRVIEVARIINATVVEQVGIVLAEFGDTVAEHAVCIYDH
jgi:hypothetical protein